MVVNAAWTENQKQITVNHMDVNNQSLTFFPTCRELSNLRNKEDNYTTNFSDLKNVNCVKGKYPSRLIDLWNLWDETYTSENDSPEIFTTDQLFVILEFSNGGKDMESYCFSNSKQSFALFQQVCELPQIICYIKVCVIYYFILVTIYFV